MLCYAMPVHARIVSDGDAEKVHASTRVTSDDAWEGPQGIRVKSVDQNISLGRG